MTQNITKLSILPCLSIAIFLTAPINCSAETKSQKFNTTLNFKIMSQLRYTLQTNAEQQGLDQDNVSGFEARRTRLFITGVPALAKTKYKVIYDFNHTSGTAELFDAFIQYDIDSKWTATLGQFRLPFNREQLVGVGAQIGMDRTQLNYAFNLGKKGGRSQGIQFDYTSNLHHLAFSLSDGVNGINTAVSTDESLALTARYEHLFFGSWTQFRRASTTSQTGLLAGFGVHYENENSIHTTGDFSFQHTGFSINGFFYTRHIEHATQTGVGIQLGEFISNQTQPFVQFTSANADLDNSQDDFNAAAIGVNYYIKGNKAKITTEIHRSFGEINAMFAKGNQGFVPDTGTSQTLLRTQLQVIF